MKAKILVIDNDRDICVLIDTVLKHAGFDTITTDSPHILRDLNEIKPDLILLDNRLDFGYGRDYCKKLKQNLPGSDITVVLMSAYDDLEQIAKESGADAILKKPFDIHELVDLVSSLCAEK